MPYRTLYAADKSWFLPRAALGGVLSVRAVCTVPVLAVFLTGCAGGSGAGGLQALDGSAILAGGGSPQPSGGAAARQEQPRPGQPVAIVAGRSVHWQELGPLLGEAAGGAILEEVVLDRMLADEFARRGVSITAADIAHERQLLERSLTQAAGAAPDEVADLLRTVRRSRGLGERRFALLLERNARLRRLIRDQVIITEEDIAQAFAIRHGPRVRARLIVVPTQADAGEVLAMLRGGPKAPPMPFAEVAALRSIDPSGLRGGLLDPISPADPTYPIAIRQALSDLEEKQISAPLALEAGFAILRVEERIPAADVDLEQVRPGLEAELRQVRERVLMDRIAGQILAAAPVLIMDEGLDWSWRSRRGGGEP